MHCDPVLDSVCCCPGSRLCYRSSFRACPGVAPRCTPLCHVKVVPVREKDDIRHPCHLGLGPGDGFDVISVAAGTAAAAGGGTGPFHFNVLAISRGAAGGVGGGRGRRHVEWCETHGLES